MVVALILSAVAVFWILCGVLAYGITLNDFESQYPYFGGHVGISVFMGTGGPIGLLATLIGATHYGWRWRPIPREEKWRIHQREFPGLSRENFERTA